MIRRRLLALALALIMVAAPVSAWAAHSAHKRVVPLPRFTPHTRVVKVRHRKWLLLESLRISHLGHTRPHVSCDCLRKPGRVHETKLRHGTITYSGINWLLRGKKAVRIAVYRRKAIGRVVYLQARLGKKPALVFQSSGCLASPTKLRKCPAHTHSPASGTPVTPPQTTAPAPAPAPTASTPAPAAQPTTTAAPAPITAPSLTATASGTEITLSGSVNANGGQVNIVIKDNTDGATYSCPGNTGTALVTCSWTETGLKYQITYSYTMTVTDASGASRAAVSASTTATTPAAPPITGANLTVIANGTSITVSGSVNAGGQEADVSVRDNTDGATHSCGSGTGTISCSWTESGLGYSTSYGYTLTATDASGYNRVPDSASASATTGPAPTPPPPSPTVAVTRGASAPTSYCAGAPSCYYIDATTANFSGNVSCQITAGYYGTTGFYTWTQGPDETKQSPDAQENRWVTVQCSGGGQTASGTGSW